MPRSQPELDATWGRSQSVRSDTLIGPRKISQVNQVAIPVDLMRLLDLVPGDSVFFEVVSEEPPEIRLVAARTVEDRYEAGRSLPDRVAEQKTEASKCGLGQQGIEPHR